MLLNTTQFLPPSISEPKAVNVVLGLGGCARDRRVVQNTLNLSSALGCRHVWEQS